MKNITYDIIANINPKLAKELKISKDYNEYINNFVTTYLDIATYKKDILSLLIKSGIYDDMQLRRFACWCARKHWHDLDTYHKECIDVAEWYTIGRMTDEQMTAVKEYAARNHNINMPKSDANVSARACCTIDAKQAAHRSALASIAYSNNTTAMHEVINYLITNI